MEEFNITDIDALTMGTPINQLTKQNQEHMTHYHETIPQQEQPLKYNPTQYTPMPERVDMRNLVKNVERDLYAKEYHQEPQHTPQIQQSVVDVVKTDNSINIELLIFILLFIVLNNKFVIDTINMIPYLFHVDFLQPNLLIRGLIFGLLIYYYKKYYENK